MLCSVSRRATSLRIFLNCDVSWIFSVSGLRLEFEQPLAQPLNLDGNLFVAELVNFLGLHRSFLFTFAI